MISVLIALSKTYAVMGVLCFAVFLFATMTRNEYSDNEIRPHLLNYLVSAILWPLAIHFIIVEYKRSTKER
jgi:hypothetical protein